MFFGQKPKSKYSEEWNKDFSQFRGMQSGSRSPPEKLNPRKEFGPQGLREDQVLPKNFSTYELNCYFLKVDNVSKNGQ